MRRIKLSPRQLLSVVLLIFWMCVIFLMSAQNGEESTHTSNSALDVLSGITDALFPSLSTDWRQMSGLIRTAGHFTEYFILGLLSANLTRSFGAKPARSFAASMVLCMLYALSDEIHQLFVDGRACELSDWLVDTASAGLGCGIYNVIGYIKMLRNMDK